MGTKKERRTTREPAVVAYSKRKQVLISLGFGSYDEYLFSQLWQSIRKRVLDKNSQCAGCGGHATAVHHDNYSREVMLGKDLRGLFPVCYVCHTKAEFTATGKKLSPQQATRRLHLLRRGGLVVKKTWFPLKKTSKIPPEFLNAVKRARVYLGMDPSHEARELVEALDTTWPNKP